MVGRLTYVEATGLELIMRTGQALAISLSAFPNTGIALARAALIVGPNPYGPWDYPISNYCPSWPWLPWPARCNDANQANSTMIEAQ